MIKKHTSWVLLSSVIISSIILVSAINYKHTTKEKVSATIFKGSHGWGYNILANGHVLIHQEYIPALPVNRGFENKGQAEQTAQLVLKKLQNGNPPAISQTEIRQILNEPIN